MAASVSASGLQVVGGQNLFSLSWLLEDGGTCLGPLLIDAVEIWASADNNRANAAKTAEGITHAVDAGYQSNVTRYFWIKARDLSGNYSDWFPSSATAGVEATTKLVQTADIEDDAATVSKLSVNELSAITANFGSANNSGVWRSQDADTIIIDFNTGDFNFQIGSMVFRGITSLGKVAVFTEPAGRGVNDDIFDPDAVWNGPLKTPSSYLSNVKFHSDFDYFELAYGPTDVTISHTALAGYTGPDIGETGMEIRIVGQSDVREYTLVTHSLGYVPRYFVAYNGSRLTNGQVVHTATGGYSRVVAPFATSSIIGLREWVSAGASETPAVSRDYEVIVFANPTADGSKPNFGLIGSTLYLGKGKIKSTNRYLREKLSGESSFDLNLGVTMDVTNGRVKVVSGGNAYIENGYDGSFSGPSFVAVGGVG